MTTLILYSTPACHLCEQAEAVIEPLIGDRFRVQVVDISESEQLVEHYGVRIPVLRRMDTGAELGWPFDRETCRDFLAW